MMTAAESARAFLDRRRGLTLFHRILATADRPRLPPNIEFCVSIPWGQAYDRYGAKRCLLVGMVGGAVTGLAFGFSVSVSMAFVSRFLAGVVNGNVGVAKSYLATVTDDTNRAKAFALMPLAWGLGVTIAPTLGGMLTKAPYRWEAFPYSLPNLVVSVFQLVSALAVMSLVPAQPHSQTHYHARI